MNRLIYLLLSFALCAITCGCDSNEENKALTKAKAVASTKTAPATSEKKIRENLAEVGEPNKVFDAYLKSRSVGYAFQGEIRSAFIRLTDDGRKAVATEMQQFMAQ